MSRFVLFLRTTDGRSGVDDAVPSPLPDELLRCPARLEFYRMTGSIDDDVTVLGSFHLGP